jgi:peptide/nickel transport system substrate-binding protein
VEFKPGESFVMERFDNFLRPGRPYFDKLIGIHVKDPSASEVAFKNEELHRAGFNSTFRLKAIPRIEKLEHITTTKKGYEAIGPISYLEFNLRKAPFNNVKVRKAIAYAIDENFITQKLHYGLSKRATGPIHYSSPFYSADVVKYDLNLEKANQLLDEAGYPKKADGTRFSATLDWLPYVFDDHQVVAEYLKPQFKKIGIDLNLRKPSDFGTWIKQVAGWNYEMTLNLIFCYPDPVIGVHRLYLTDNIKHVPWSNTQGYSNPQVDELLAKAAVEMDFNKRKALYEKFQRIVTEDVPMVFIHSPAYHTISNSNLRGAKQSVWGVMAPNDSMYWKDGKTPK